MTSCSRACNNQRRYRGGATAAGPVSAWREPRRSAGSQELLGHAQVSITLDRYSHMTPRLMSNAAAGMERLLDEEA